MQDIGWNESINSNSIKLKDNYLIPATLSLKSINHSHTILPVEWSIDLQEYLHVFPGMSDPI